jgi:hypothetical protein
VEIGFASNCWEDDAVKVQAVNTALELALSPLFEGISYGGGVDRFVVGIISVWSDPAKNAKSAKPSNKAGYFKNPFTGKIIRYISIAFPVDPEHLSRMSSAELELVICDYILGRLQNIGFKLPREFDFAGFAVRLSIGIEIYKKSKLNTE